jgi:hypothetical protein
MTRKKSITAPVTVKFAADRMSRRSLSSMARQ